MNAFDIALLVVFGVSVIIGYRRGFISQIGSLAAIVAGIIACRLWGHGFTAWFAPTAGLDATGFCAPVLGNIILFLIVYLLVTLVAMFLRRIAHTVLLGLVDGVAGSAFCAFKWLFLCSVILNIWALCFPDSVPAGKEQNAVTIVRDIAPRTLGAFNIQINQQ